MKKYSYYSSAKQGEAVFRIEKANLQADFECHTHDFNELVFILDGTGIHEIDCEQYSIKKGDVFVIKGNSVHGFKKVNQLRLINIMYYEQNLIDFADYKTMPGFWALFVNQPSLDKKEYLTLPGQQYLEFLQLCYSMLREFNTAEHGSRTVCLAYFYQAVVFLSRLVQNDDALHHQVFYRLGQVLSYIETNYTNDIQVQQLAEICFLSPRHFSRKFHQIFQETPLNYILNLRIEHAKSLLIQANQDISRISALCGFSDSNYFSRCFKHRVGVSPREWQKNYFSIQNNGV